MKRRSKAPSENVFETSELPSHIYRAGEIIRILAIPKWRFQKFLSGKNYPLSPSGQIGKGAASWRLFRLEDVYRIGIANFLTQDGFGPKTISKALQFIEDSDLIEFGAEGRKRPPLVGFIRGPKEAKVVYIPRTKAISATSDAPYYVLDLGRIVTEIDRRIEELVRGHRS